MTRARLLIVDDEAIARDNLAHALQKEYEIETAADGQSALARVQAVEFDLLLTDLRMKGLDGLELLTRAKLIQPDLEVIVITGHATIDTAVQAMRQGAYYYLTKPVRLEELRLLVRKALEKRTLATEVQALRRQVKAQSGLGRLIGQSPKMLALKETIIQIAQLDCNILILGETGTGKELVARSIHESSPRAGRRFMAVNCGAFSEDLIAHELFGHDREAFTGAGREKVGLLEAAEGGTVLFDEVAELSLSMQVKLLRVLQERSLFRLGGTKEIPVDLRVLAATNKDLKKEVEQGNFRQDLYYRLNVITIQVPPLAERLEDVALLARHFLAKHTPAGSPVKELSADVLARLQSYQYPGNVRELENIIERAAALGDGPAMEARHLWPDLRRDEIRVVRPGLPAAWPTLEEQERDYIRAVMEEVQGNKTRAAQILGIDRVSLWRKLKRYRLDEPDAE